MLKKTLLISTLMLGLVTSQAQARSWVDDSDNRIETNVVKDDTIVMRTDTAFREVRVANADVADVVILTNKTFQVLGKRSGRTNVMLYDVDNRLVDIIDVRVGYDVADLRRTLYESFPEETVKVKEIAGGLYLSGDVRDGNTAERVINIAQAYAPEKVTNGLSVRDSHQVMLEVRFVEATRDVVKNLGVGLLVQTSNNFLGGSQSDLFPADNGDPLSTFANAGLAATGFGNIGATSINAKIDALEEDGVIRTLAEPNLVAMSGDTASFLAGGEFPIPVAQDEGQISVSFRQFGVSLSFTPTVLDDGIINLKVAPEVSQIDTANAVNIGSGVFVPGLRVRRADTTIELRNSQSFAIAGLLENNVSNNKAQIPWLGDVPVLGSLFRSSQYLKSETELLIIVTPRLVQPARDIKDLATPLDYRRNPTESEFFLNGQLDGKLSGPSAPNNGFSASSAQPASRAKRIAPNQDQGEKQTARAGGLKGEYGYALQ